MSRTVTAEPLGSTRHAFVLFGAAAVLFAAGLSLSPRWLPAVVLATGTAAVFTVVHHARARRRRARRDMHKSHLPSGGRINERREQDRVLFDLPADGLEPWGFDAWVLAVSTFATFALARGMSGGQVALSTFLAALFSAVALRLRAAGRDRIQLEIGKAGWRVEALEGGRVIRRSGTGPILPELRGDALFIWSTQGRVGVLRRELEAEERTWLKNRLSELAELDSTSKASHEMDQEQARQDRKSEQGEHAE